jgi:hypothetical protein
LFNKGLERLDFPRALLNPLPGNDPGKVAIDGSIHQWYDNPARLDGGAPADEKRSQCQSTTQPREKG